MEHECTAARACERVIYQFALFLDDPKRRRAIGDLFTEDGVLEVPATGRRVEGRETIAEYFDDFPEDLVTRRLITNVLVDVSGSRATASSYFTAFQGRGVGGGSVAPPPVSVVGCYEDDFACDAARWRISHRVVVVTFGTAIPQLD